MIKPGNYILQSDITNPCADRRKTRDWRAFPVWKAGWEFLVQEYTHDIPDVDGLDEAVVAKIKANASYTVVVLVGHRWTNDCIGPGHDEQYAALEKSLVPVAESLDAVFTRLDVRDYFAQWLVKSRRMSPELFESLWDAYQEDGGEDEYAVGRRLVESEELT